jgi:hypothetical protein
VWAGHSHQLFTITPCNNLTKRVLSPMHRWESGGSDSLTPPTRQPPSEAWSLRFN